MSTTLDRTKLTPEQGEEIQLSLETTLLRLIAFCWFTSQGPAILKLFAIAKSVNMVDDNGSDEAWLLNTYRSFKSMRTTLMSKTETSGFTPNKDAVIRAFGEDEVVASFPFLSKVVCGEQASTGTLSKKIKANFKKDEVSRMGIAALASIVGREPSEFTN